MDRRRAARSLAGALVVLGCLGATGCDENSNTYDDGVSLRDSASPSANFTNPGLSGAGTETRPASPEPDQPYLEPDEQDGDGG